MCNASDDVHTLKRNKQLTESQGKVRVDTVASSASTTAKVAAVIQRGGSFFSRLLHRHGMGRRLRWKGHRVSYPIHVVHFLNFTARDAGIIWYGASHRSEDTGRRIAHGQVRTVGGSEAHYE